MGFMDSAKQKLADNQAAKAQAGEAAAQLYAQRLAASGLETAATRAGISPLADKRLREVPNRLLENEIVHEVEAAQYDLLVVTSWRVLVIRDPKNVDEYPLNRVTQVGEKSGFRKDAMWFSVENGYHSFPGMNKGRGKVVGDAIRNASNALNAPRPVATAPASIAEQISQLAVLRESGVLSQAEFDSTKASLLDRM